MPLERVNQLTRLVPTTLHITIGQALAQSPDLRQAYESDPVVHEVIDIARTLEGTNRNAGTHAAGVVIANGPLVDHVPLQRVLRKGDDGGGKRGEAVMPSQPADGMWSPWTSPEVYFHTIASPVITHTTTNDMIVSWSIADG